MSIALPALIGCHSAGQLVTQCTEHQRTPNLAYWPCEGTSGQLARQFYELACNAADHEDPTAPDYYYQSAILSYPYLLTGDGDTLCANDAFDIYHSSVAELLIEADHHGRLRCGKLTVYQPDRSLSIPIACLDLPWQPAEVGKLLPVDYAQKSKLARYHDFAGYGLPLVGTHQSTSPADPNDKFLPPNLPFAATTLLRPSGTASEAVLELHNPISTTSIPIDGQNVAMARDLSAPFDYQLRNRQDTSIIGFLDPGVPEEAAGLRFIEPYQPGKIPVVFVHGLLSDPSTWFDTANDLRMQPWFNEHYQVWGFRYASGMPFITSAMQLRAQLTEAVQTIDPEGQDPALRQMVLIGHSMGGLIAKLQVTDSDEQIWRSFANIPFDNLQASGQVRSGLAERSFFQPLPVVSRVVFIATPHRGSSMATRGIGRAASAMVDPPAEAQQMHDKLIADNPNAFSPLFERRVPTSIDLLEPENETLQAVRQLRVSPRVRMHSIIGTGKYMIPEGEGDGAVAVESALHPGVLSERFVDAKHTEIQHHPDTVAEVSKILQAHLQETRRGNCKPQ